MADLHCLQYPVGVCSPTSFAAGKLTSILRKACMLYYQSYGIFLVGQPTATEIERSSEVQLTLEVSLHPCWRKNRHAGGLAYVTAGTWLIC